VSQNQIIAAFRHRENMVKLAIQMEKESNSLVKVSLMNERREKYRSLAVQMQGQAKNAQLDVSDEALNKPKKEMDIYEPIFRSKTEFYSTYNPDMIEEALVNWISKMKPNLKISPKKYKIKFSLRV